MTGQLEARLQTTIQELKEEYRSRNKYFSIWSELKQYGCITVTLADDDTFDIVRKNLKKLKGNDYSYMAALRLELGYQLELVFEELSKDTMMIKLKDTKDKLSLNNFN